MLGDIAPAWFGYHQCHVHPAPKLHCTGFTASMEKALSKAAHTADPISRGPAEPGRRNGSDPQARQRRFAR
jgi:hypothetical protein